LRGRKIHGMSVIRCEGFGRRIDNKLDAEYEDASVELGFAPKVKIEIVCRKEDEPVIVQTIREYARTGRHGDGKIFVSTVDEAEDIRTGAKGGDVV